METESSIFFPTIELPLPLIIPRQIITYPKAKVPSYIPMVVPPNNLQAPEGVKMEQEEISLLPLPRKVPIVMTSGST